MHPVAISETLKDVLLFLATAAVIVPLFGRLKISQVLGFLAAGVALGPFGMGAVARSHLWFANFAFTDLHQIAGLGDMGVVFLLFLIGLGLTWERLMRMRKLVFGLGSAQAILSAAVLAIAGIALGLGPIPAAILGAALALSSTAIVLPALAERKRLGTTAGRASFAVLLFQDLAVAPLLFMIALLGSPGGAHPGIAALYALGTAVAALAILIGAGRLVFRPLFHLVAATKSNELFVAACLLVVIGTGVITAMSGQSMALGAFIAGLLLAETEYRRQIEVTVQPFQGLLLGLFFVSVGASLDLSLILTNPIPTLGVAAGLIVLKAAITYPVARVAGLPPRVAREVAAVLAPAGEFALVAIGAALAAGIVPHAAGTTALVAATLSMFAIPALVRLPERIAPEPVPEDPTLPQSGDPLDENPIRVIIVGYGRVGELVGQMLARHGYRFLALDGDSNLVKRVRAGGTPIYYGDATRIEFLRRCGIANARALVVTMDVPSAVEAVVTAARRERADLAIVARARDALHAEKLYALKVTDAVPETIEASLQLSEALLIALGMPMGPVIASIHEKRDEFRHMLQGVGDTPRHAIRPTAQDIEQG